MLTNPILAANTDSFFLAFSPEFLAYKKRVVKSFSLAPALWILLLFAPEFLAFSPEFLAFSPEFLAFSPEFLAFSPEFLAFSPEFLAFHFAQLVDF